MPSVERQAEPAEQGRGYRRIGLRRRLACVILLVCLPLAAERVYSLYHEREAQVRAALASLSVAARVVGLSQGETIASAIAITQLLARQASTLLEDPASCNQLMRWVSADAVGIQGAYIADRSGIVKCASPDALLGTDLSDRSYAKEALTSQRPVVSEFLLARRTGRAVLVVAEAQRDVRGDPIALAAVGLDIQWMSRVAAQAGVQTGTSVTVLDSRGVVVARHPAQAGILGASYRDHPLFVHMRERDEGTFEGMAFAGTAPGIYSFIRVPGTGMHVVVGRDRDTVIGAADQRMITMLGVSLGIIALISAFAIYLADRLIVMPIDRLAANVAALSRGDTLEIPGNGIEEFQPILDAYAGMSRRLAERAAALRSLNGRLAALASTDGLTSLANRRTFDVQFSEEWVRCADSARPIALVIADVDHFKLFNDMMGHPAGDAALRGVARMLSAAVSGTKYLAARYGGEEFIILLPDADLTTALELAETIRRLVLALDIDHPRVPSGRLSASFGVASVVPSQAHSPDALLAAADAALYEAKRLGRNRVVAGKVEAVEA